MKETPNALAAVATKCTAHHRPGPGGLPLGLASNEGLGVDEPVVLGMCADPETMNAAVTRQPEGTVSAGRPWRCTACRHRAA